MFLNSKLVISKQEWEWTFVKSLFPPFHTPQAPAAPIVSTVGKAICGLQEKKISGVNVNDDSNVKELKKLAAKFHALAKYCRTTEGM